MRQFLSTEAPNVKQEDAKLLLKRMRATLTPDSSSSEPFRAPLEFSAGAA